LFQPFLSALSLLFAVDVAFAVLNGSQQNDGAQASSITTRSPQIPLAISAMGHERPGSFHATQYRQSVSTLFSPSNHGSAETGDCRKCGWEITKKQIPSGNDKKQSNNKTD
jgi:hypothetical protein